MWWDVAKPGYPLAVPDSVLRVVIDTDGGPLAAFDSRPAGPARGAAVFVPGFSGSKEDFIPMLAMLSSAGYRIVCVDQRGQYESAGPMEPDAYSMASFTEDLLAVITAVGAREPVHLLGHSFGGLVARRAAIAAPSRVRSLTLFASGPDGASMSRRRLLGPLTWLIRLTSPAVIAAMLALVGPRTGVPHRLLPWVRYRLQQSNPANLIAICRAMATEPDLVEELLATAIPCLVLCGEDDDAWSADTQTEMAGRLAARVVVIKNAGHTPNEDQPEATAEALLTFWKAIDAC
jgi:pimeloyl-ACP methyl ester carboxylesterase